MSSRPATPLHGDDSSPAGVGSTTPTAMEEAQPHLREAHSFLNDTPASAVPGNLTPPYPAFMLNRQSIASNIDSNPASSHTPSVLQQSSPLIAQQQKSEQSDFYHREFASTPKRSKRHAWLLFAAASIAIIAAIVLGLYFGLTHKKNSGGASSGSGSGPSAQPTSTGRPKGGIVYGGDGTQVTTEQGNTFTYNNKFGGYFVTDSGNPFNDGARPQSWTPPLNQSWRWGKDRVFGVNLGGWLVLEPFITPALYQKYPTAVDEWTLSQLMAADTAGGGIAQLEEHYKTFITEEDFAQIAGAGLNWVRLPIPFWAIDTWAGEPFLAKVSWKYALKAFEWARKYGLRICLDLHTAPGSQNGYNHSGQVGKINFLNGVMGVANAQRLLHYIRIITEFITQPQYKDVILMFGIVNEPAGVPIGPLSNFYLEAHNIIRSITGVGEGKGPFISIHDNFGAGRADWSGFLSGSDRIALEPHPYFAFNGQGSADVTTYIPQSCSTWGPMMNSSQTGFGVTTAGEWSLGFNDCGLFLNTPADDHTTSAATCAIWNAWENYTPTQKANLMSFAKSSMDSLGNWFFWTWKIGPSATDGKPRSPLWSYKLGLENGWIPTNPQDAVGFCASLGVAPNTPFDGTYLPYQTGGAGAGTVNAADVAAYGHWPPTSIGLEANAALLPTYTATGAVPTLPPNTFPPPTPSASINVGNGWFNPADTALGVTTVAGCNYPNAWDATGVAVPPVCTGPAARKREAAPEPMVTHVL